MSSFVRLLVLPLSALWLVARAGAHLVRRRSGRVRRYAAEPPAPRPRTVTGPIPIIWPSSRTGAAVAPPLPAERPLDVAPARVVPMDPYRHRARRDASRSGSVVLVAVARQAEERPAVAA
ncbi:hypothetical protein Q8791_29140 [Nocardiopsis sp. CT-R113]|uniref:Secreted protein n=1 Tax=Nocardiopsis codii TaxID=3065942 RepID=A0ABU7KGF3_9ACTN|nr:hypothetical protein [Nocardiopsis sp. CT-R113]MEE2041298.1 hypothetical protein [Nocardiopsis sp. CT-R113]